LMVMAVHMQLTPGGAMGVDVFFVLSGWLITGILVGEVRRTGRIEYRAFLARRARRLFPALALMLAIYTPLAIYTATDLSAIFFAATSTSNLRAMLVGNHGALGPTWSLGVEWQFYLLWPLIVAAVAGRRIAAPLMLGGWALLTVARGLVFLGHWYDLAYFSPLHSSGLFLGAALAMRPEQNAPRWMGWTGLAVILSTLLVSVHRPAAPEIWSIPLAEFGAALVILSPPRALSWSPLVWLGTVSYAVYLWHLPVWIVLGRLTGLSHVLWTIALTVIAAALSWRYVEKPIMHARRRATVSA